MNKNLELIQELIKQAEQIAYRNGQLDAVEKKSRNVVAEDIWRQNTLFGITERHKILSKYVDVGNAR